MRKGKNMESLISAMSIEKMMKPRIWVMVMEITMEMVKVMATLHELLLVELEQAYLEASDEQHCQF